MELLLEFVLQIVAELFGDILVHWLPERGRNVFFTILGYAALGAVIAALTLLVLPAHLIRSHELRIANLIVTPLLVAALMAWIGAMRRRRDKRVVQMEEFVYAYTTALAFGLVRFFGAD